MFLAYIEVYIRVAFGLTSLFFVLLFFVFSTLQLSLMLQTFVSLFGLFSVLFHLFFPFSLSLLFILFPDSFLRFLHFPFLLHD